MMHDTDDVDDGDDSDGAGDNGGLDIMAIMVGTFETTTYLFVPGFLGWIHIYIYIYIYIDIIYR